jgi:hypothetical protein
MIFFKVRPKNRQKIGKKLAFIAQTTASFCKNLIVTWVLEKKPAIFAKNWRKSQKIVIITSTPEQEKKNSFLQAKCIYVRMYEGW